MNLWAYFLAKKESFSAHLAWGALLGLVVSHRTGEVLVAVPLAAIVGLGWEMVSGYLSHARWRPDVRDVLPWILGGGLASLLEAVVL